MSPLPPPDHACAPFADCRNKGGKSGHPMTIRLRDLSQGALLHVVCALLAGPMKAEQIARRTGKSHETVQRALATLDEEFHLVTAVPDGRWPIWCLRDTSQLELPLPGLLGRPDVDASSEPVDNSPGLTTQISKSSRSSSRGVKDDRPESSELPLLPVIPQLSQSPGAPRLIDQLTRLGATPAQAARAITTALKRRQTTAQISNRIAQLAAYAKENRTIRNPGQWALGYIATGCALPEITPTAARDYSGDRPYLTTNSEDKDPAP